MDERKTYRLVTKCDLDGLISGILLKFLGIVTSVKFVSYKEIFDGNVLITDSDITVNLPYVGEEFLAFDTVQGEKFKNKKWMNNYICDLNAKSTSRVIYDYYGGIKAFPKKYLDLVNISDKCSSGEFTLEDVKNPKGWILLNFIIDYKTGLEKVGMFRMTDHDLLAYLMDFLSSYTIGEALKLADVSQRVEILFSHTDMYIEQIKRCAKVHDNLVVIDLRKEEMSIPGNRYLIYTLFPECNVSLQINNNSNKTASIISLGKSIFNNTYPQSMTKILLKYGGTGNDNYSMCQLANDKIRDAKRELINEFTLPQDLVY